MSLHLTNSFVTRFLSGMLACAAVLVFPAITHAHDQEPPWLDPNNLSEGLYIDVRSPRVLRQVAPFDVSLVVRNMASGDDVTIERMTYRLPGRDVVWTAVPNRTLPAQKAVFAEYQAARQSLREAHKRRDRDAIALAHWQSHALARQLSREVYTDRRTVPVEMLPVSPGEVFELVVEIDLTAGGKRQTLRRDVKIPVVPPLPNGTEMGRACRYSVATGRMEIEPAPADRSPRSGEPLWLAGDQHVHTKYSLDAVVLHGTDEDVTYYAETAELIGLSWMIVTDHSNVHATWGDIEYYTEAQFDEATAQAAAYSATHDLVALVGEEMGAGRTGFWDLPSHYLAYPYETASTGFLENPSSGLVFGIADCEDEQVIIDRINNAGGFGFIAHPFDSGTLVFAEWDFDNGATGWAGLEIWSDTDGILKSTDEEARAKWHQLLGEIAPPHLGELLPRADFPSAFPVGLGNSDAHEPELLANTFTYAWMDVLSRENAVGSLMQGRCIATNGPLLFAEIGDSRIGEVALLAAGNTTLSVHLATTSEFGPVGDYELRVLVNGSVRVTIPASGLPDFALDLVIDDLALTPSDAFVTIEAASSDSAFHAFTNPIWLQFPLRGDMNDDGVVDLSDVPLFVDVLTGAAMPTRYQRFAADMTEDTAIDGRDIAPFVAQLLGAP